MSKFFLPLFAAMIIVSCSKEGGGSGDGNGNCTKLTSQGSSELADSRHPHNIVSVGNKVIFAGGFANGTNLKVADIYNVDTKVWGKTQLSEARYAQQALVVVRKAFFTSWSYAPGDTYTGFVDVYDDPSMSWIKLTLSEGRKEMVMVSGDNKVFFAGGLNRFGAISKTIDVYNLQNLALSHFDMKEARHRMAVIVSGNKLLMAGGQLTNGSYSKKLHIYNITTTAWDSVMLSEARADITAIVAGNKILFAGGRKSATEISKTVDVLDIQTNTITSHQLSERYSQNLLGDASVVAGNRVLLTHYASKTVEIYDLQTGGWSSVQLSAPFDETEPVSAGDKAFFAGGLTGSDYSNKVDIYNAVTGSWSSTTLSEAKGDMGVAVGSDKILFAGGQRNNNTPADLIEAYDISAGTWSTVSLSKGTSRSPKGLVADDKVVFALFSDAGYKTTVDLFNIVSCN